ncbi:RCC1-like domain-containing protein [Paenibacillus amylolyticus]|uniref:RCC1-like domain-containing protein n=1 Tax=Paenibacillus amylolyticus TaxID=1451 RepID=UPI00201D5CE8|nr:RCC1 domain-containing protein [Paenibacillus amylolyticus]MCL6663428.1 RCC1 domain-containing protein [Paenibacillus amylolyticus]
MENNKKKDQKKYRIGWKRSLIVTLVVALVVGTYSFADSGTTASAAEYVKIKEINNYDDGVNSRGVADTYLAYSMLLDNGNAVVFNAPSDMEVFSGNYKKFERYINSNSPDGYTYSYIDNVGDYYQKKAQWNTNFDKVFTQAEDFATITYGDVSNGRLATFILGRDGFVYAMGYGLNGELGLGYKQSKTVPTEVVDPETGDPLEGVKKIYYLSRNSVLLVTDSSVYLVGKAFGLDTRTKAMPIKLDSIFPTFTSANDFKMTYLEGIKFAWNASTLLNGMSTSYRYFDASRKVFTIKGKQYALSNLVEQNNHIEYPFEADRPSLIELPSDFDYTKMKRTVVQPNGGGSADYNLSTGNFMLEQGTLYRWGSPISTFGSYAGGKDYDPTKVQINTGVTSYSPTVKGDVFVLKSNGYLYVRGPSPMTGVVGGTVDNFIRVTGPSNEVKDVAEVAASGVYVFARKNDGTVIAWASPTTFATLKNKYLGFITVPQYGDGRSLVLGVSEAGDLYNLNNAFESQISGISNIAPPNYIAPSTKPSTPVLSTVSQDKFDQFTLGIDYGTDTGLAVKEYQIGSGAWTAYTGEFVVRETGTLNVKARSADSKGNVSDEGSLQLVSNPIVISVGDPNVTKVSANEFKISAQATGTVKTQVRVDGAAWQDHNVANNLLLAPGSHTIDVRLMNSKDQELVSKSFTVSADSPAPVVIPKPTVSQVGLNSTFGLDLDVQYDTSAGEAQYSVDGGAWTATTGTISVSNEVHTVRVKVVATDRTESEVVNFVTTKIDPKVEIVNDTLKIDMGVTAPSLKVYYRDNVNGVWTEYTGPVTYPPGTYTFDVEVRQDASGNVVYSGGPFTLVVPDPNTGNPGDGGTTPTPDPGTGTTIGDEDVDFTVNSGGLSSRFEGADLSTIIIDNTNPYQSINSVSRALLEDSRGNGKGYQYSLDVTDFVSDPMQDNSTNSQNLVVSIPANSLSVDVLNSKTLNGPPAELSNVGKHVFTGTGPEMLATANSFEGMGYYEIPLNFTLSVPDRVKITSSGSGSKFIPGESTGLMAGIYKSKFTFTLSSGI